MRFCVVTPFAVKTKKTGVIHLSQGQVIELAEEKARSFLTEGKIRKCFNTYSDVIKAVTEMFDGIVVGFIGDQNELYEERAAIMEYDGGLTKRQAEAEAANIILNHLT